MSNVYSEQVLLITRGQRLLPEPIHLFINPYTFSLDSPHPPHTVALPVSFVKPDNIGSSVSFTSQYETSMKTRRAFVDWVLKGKSRYYTALLYSLEYEGASVHKVVAARYDALKDYYAAQNHMVESYLRAQLEAYPLERL